MGTSEWYCSSSFNKVFGQELASWQGEGERADMLCATGGGEGRSTDRSVSPLVRCSCAGVALLPEAVTAGLSGREEETVLLGFSWLSGVLTGSQSLSWLGGETWAVLPSVSS